MTNAKQQKQHYKPSGFDQIGGELVIAGQKVSDLVQQYGSPLYVYDGALISGRIDYWRHHMPKNLHLHYAIKANPMPELLAMISPLVDGLDVASGGELDKALATGVAPDRISFAGPGKQDWELEQAIKAGITLNVESERELRRIEALAATLETPATIAIRVNPDFELKSSGMKMGGGAKPFGIDAERVSDVASKIDEAWVRLVGLHIFTGSQNLKISAIEEGLVNTLALAKELQTRIPQKLQHINIGGGLGVPYFEGEEPLDMVTVGAFYQRHLSAAQKVLPTVQFIMELGRFLVAEAGVYLTRIVDKKISRGTTYLVCDGGMHHYLALSGNFGQIVRRNYAVDIATQMASQTLEEVSLVGPLCTPLDRLGDKMILPCADVGDVVAIYQSGAYGLSASPTAFLGHRPAAEVLLKSK